MAARFHSLRDHDIGAGILGGARLAP